MPPRHGKSSLLSHWFPVWFFDWWPHKRFILASYAADFAASWGRKVRNSIEQFRGTLRVQVAGDSSAADRWDTTAGGGMITAGSGGPITGRGADILGVDDPIKNWEEAQSPTIREKIWDWWKSTAYTRLEPGGSAFIVATRWHVEDLNGQVLKEMTAGGEPWMRLRLPALAEKNDPLGRLPGEALWPERYPVEELKRIHKAVGTRVWMPLYQQHPVQEEGGIFQRHWFEIVDRERVPRIFRRAIRFWDLAATKKTTADYLVGVKMGATLEGMIYVMDVQRLQVTPHSVEKVIRQTAMTDGKAVGVRIEQEGGASGKIVVSDFVRRVLEGFDARGVPPWNDKVARAMPFSAAAERGDVKLMRAAWNADYLEELCQFPTGENDDQVDGSSGAYQQLCKATKQTAAQSIGDILSYR